MGQVNCEILVEVREAWLYNTNSVCFEAFLSLGSEDWQLTPELQHQHYPIESCQ